MSSSTMEFTSIALLCLILTGFITAEPLVTLQHGGQLRGKSFNYDGQMIDLFLGVRYAAAPVGLRRFQKPSPPEPWTGTIDVVSASSSCIQLKFPTPELIGDEDCLFMDITVPGGVDPANRKPVMVFIHGGGYTFGSKDSFIGASLAKHGDVIVVAINYRLDALGFLYDGPGTGNFGLWDQRAALVWIQDNIQRFGGDPELVTIFGESAGGGSVSAQLMGQHNKGLFKRGIQESGSLYTDWGWYTSERQWKELVADVKRKRNCPSSMSVYDCLAGLSVKTLNSLLPPSTATISRWHPMPDNDFFPPEVINEDYNLSRRFDLLAGFNGQDGVFGALLPTLAGQPQESIANGMSENYVNTALNLLCSKINQASVNLCKNFLSQAYDLANATDDQDRGQRLSYATGGVSFKADVVRQLVAHSVGTQATYAYHFVEAFHPTVTQYFPITPPWLKISAYHIDELPYVFGTIHNKEHSVWTEYFGPELTEEASLLYSYMNQTTAEDKPLTDTMMTMWTNFARTGNPNKPKSLPSGVPVWPEFDTKSNQFMELSRKSRVVTTPHKEILELLTSTVLEARLAQLLADKGMECREKKQISSPADAVVG